MTEQNSWREGMDLRIQHEITHIISQFGEHGIDVTVGRNSDGGGYMYAVQHILVLEEYLDRVVEILRRRSQRPEEEQRESGQREPEGGPAGEREIQHQTVIVGVRLLPLAEFGLDVPTALDYIDEEIGEGVATPDHVLSVAPEAGPCPATEPQEVYGDTGPYPAECGTKAGTGVKIYIGDTGLLMDAPGSHSWLAGVDGDEDPNAPDPAAVPPQIQPYGGHGTFVAGVARCMAPAAEIYVANIFRIAGSALESHMVRRLRAALGHGVDIFHLSIVAPTRKELPLAAFRKWLNLLAEHQGVICVAAAGNNSSRGPYWPGALPEVITVGALALDWRSRASFSNFGGWVDVYAPGTNLINAYATGDYTCQIAPYQGTVRKFFGMAQWSGTSFSTPMVTGLIAARMSRTSENAEEAAAALLIQARAQAIPGVGPVLLPCCDDDDPPRHSSHCGHARSAECCCGAHHHHHHPSVC